MKNIFLKRDSTLRGSRGFTLLELLVVVAIITIVSAIVFVALGSSRKKGDDAAIQSNLLTLANQAGIFFLENGNLFLPLKDPKPLDLSPCKASPEGNNMFSADKMINSAMWEAIKRSDTTFNSYCANSANSWAIAMPLKLEANTSWCVDSGGASKKENMIPQFAILAVNSTTFRCK